MPTRFVLSTLLVLSGVFVLPLSSFAYQTTYFDNTLLADNSAGTLSVNNIATTTPDPFQYYQIHLSYNNSTSTFTSINKVSVEGFSYSTSGEEVYNTWGDECNYAFMYIYRMATSSMTASPEDFFDESGPDMRYMISAGEALTPSNVSNDGITDFLFDSPFTLFRDTDYTFVIVPACWSVPDTKWWRFSIDLQRSDVVSDVNSGAYLWSNETQTYSAYTNSPDALTFSIEYDSTVAAGFASEYISIDSVQWIASTTLETSACTNDSVSGITTSCSTATTSDTVFINWSFNYPVGATDEYDVNVLLTKFDGGYPFDLPLSTWLKNYDNVQPFYLGETVYPLQRGDDTSVTGMYNVHVCLSNSNFATGGEVCTDMLLCNNVDDALCESTRSTLYGGGTIEQPVSCDWNDIECLLKKAFIPNQGFMIALVSQASSTIATVWPVGYLTREWYAYSAATSSAFDIPLNMAAFGLPTTTASINLTEASQGVYALSDTIDDFVDLLETICWALFWLLLAYRLYNGKQTVHQLAEA